MDDSDKPRTGKGSYRKGKKYLYNVTGTGEAFGVLRRRAQELGLTDTDLAALSGFTQATISMWNAGKHEPSMDAIAFIADQIGAEIQVTIRIKGATERIKQFRALKRAKRKVKKRTQELTNAIREQQRAARKS